MPREDSEFCRRNEIFLIYNVWRNFCNLSFLRNMYSFVCFVCAFGFRCFCENDIKIFFHFV